jgi:uroporphyrinogen decarboxylase
METDRQDWLATVEHRRPGRILYHANFTPDLRRRVREHIGSDDIGAHYGFMETCGIGPKPGPDQQAIDYSRYYADEELPEGTRYNAAGVAQVPAGYYHFFGFVSPLRQAGSLQEIEDYPLPDPAGWQTDHMAAEAAAAKEAGRVVMGMVGHMYETAWQIRGYEQFLMDMVERPEWAACLLDKLIAQAGARATAAARAGADYIHCGDDVANQQSLMFSKPMWQEFMLSRWSKVWAEVKAINPECRVWYHSDGNIHDIIGDLIDAGVDILNPLQPECLDLDAVHGEFGDRVTFDGCMGTQTTMPFGSPEDVRARVRELIESYGRNGGLIISPTHVLEPEVPLENIDAMAEACREYGEFRTP